MTENTVTPAVGSAEPHSVQPSAPRSIGGVIDDALRLYRASFRRCWVFAFTFSAVIFVFRIALVASLPDVRSSTGENFLRALSVVGWPRITGLYLTIMLLSLICYGAMLTSQFAVARGEIDLSLGRALAEGARHLPGMIVASLISFVALMLGTAALIIPGVYFWGKLLLWMPAMFAERVSGTAALGASWRLTEGLWWRGVTIFTVGVIIAIVVLITLGLVGGILGSLIAVSHSLGGRTEQTIIQQLFGIVLNTLLYPFMSALMIAMYHDFKLRREGGDLAARVGALSNA